MNQIQPYIVPTLIIIYFAWRFFRFKKVRAQMPELLKKGAIVIDVRSSAEFSAGASPGSLNIPLDRLEKEIKKLDHQKPIILCCASGSRSALAAHMLKKQGFETVINGGSWSNVVHTI